MSWLGKDPVLWVLDEAPDVPARLVATLVAVARYAHADGRNAHPSASTIAAHIRKTERQAKRDLAELVELGLLVRGNPAIVAKFRADKRPNVYDLPMPRGDTHDTPSSASGVTPRAERGDIQGHSGVSPMSPKEILNRTGKRARGPESPPDAPGSKPPGPAMEIALAAMRARLNGKGARR